MNKTKELEERIAKLEEQVSNLQPKKNVSASCKYNRAIHEILKPIIHPITGGKLDWFLNQKITALAREIFVSFIASPELNVSSHDRLATIFEREGWGEPFDKFKSIVTSIAENVAKILSKGGDGSESV